MGRHAKSVFNKRGWNSYCGCSKMRITRLKIVLIDFIYLFSYCNRKLLSYILLDEKKYLEGVYLIWKSTVPLIIRYIVFFRLKNIQDIFEKITSTRTRHARAKIRNQAESDSQRKKLMSTWPGSGSGKIRLPDPMWDSNWDLV